MQDRHEPSDRFIEGLGHEIGAEVRRRNRLPVATGWRDLVGLKMLAAAAALVVVSMAVGGAVVAAAYQNESREQLRALVSVYERKLQSAKARLDAAKADLLEADRSFSAGLTSQDTTMERRQAVAEAEAQVQIAQLNIVEVQVTGREPRDEVWAPVAGKQDFVRERLELSMSVQSGALELEKRRLQAMERRVSVGLAQPDDGRVIRARIVGLEAALQASQEKIAIRQMFVAGKVDAQLAELRLVETEAMQRYQALKPQYQLALQEKQRIESLVSKGLASPVDVTKANIRVLETQTELERLELEVMIAKQKIAERTGAKGAGS